MKALFPLDGSERSLAAMVRGAAMLPDAEITLYAVQSGGFDNAPEDVVEEFAVDGDDEVFPTKDSCKEMLQASKKHLGDRKVHLKIGHGNYVKEILATAADYDVLVMHALDKNQLRETVRMSSLEKLCRKAPCSVLLVAD